jgi:hypothetical protein
LYIVVERLMVKVVIEGFIRIGDVVFFEERPRQNLIVVDVAAMPFRVNRLINIQ